ncbi:hypothetical protein BGZ58_006482 [Dissophora ornata]|nr:hypothetical protein BGZ58_006482 [Dissophora ornata]
MDNDKTPTRTPSRSSHASESPRQQPQQTPRTPTTARTRTTSIGRATPYSGGASPSPSTKISASRGSTGSNASSISDTSTIQHGTSTTEETNTTTPVYSESTTLISSTTSNSKLQLSDMQPVDARILDRIKSLEISIKQHRDSEEQLKRNLHGTREEAATEKECHDQVMKLGEARLRILSRMIDHLQAQILKNSGKLQEHWKVSRELHDDLSGRENELIEIKNQFQELQRHREEILRDKEESEKELQRAHDEEKDRLISELEELAEMKQECSETSVELKGNFGLGTVEAMKQSIQERKERIMDLERMLSESKSVVMVDEVKADELVQLFDKVHERRIQSHTEDLEQALQSAKTIESIRDKEANEALEEYLHINQLSIEAEEKASREEFSLLTEQEELSELESTLRSLKMELSQRLQTATVNT